MAGHASYQPREIIRLLDKQRAFLTCTAEWAAAMGGVGSGKTIAATWWILERLECWPKHVCYVIGADFNQLRRGFFQSMKGTLKKAGFEDGVDFKYRPFPSPQIKIFYSGAVIESVSAEQEEKLRSLETQTLYLEEPQTWNDGYVVFGIVSERLRVREDVGLMYPDIECAGRMTFNPPPTSHWLYDLTMNKWPEMGWPLWRMPLTDNYLLLERDPGYVRRIEMAIPKHRVRVEIEGHWAETGGSVYREFDREKMAVKHVEGLPALAIDYSRPLLWSLDFNVHKQCSVIGQMRQLAMVTRGISLGPNGYPTETFRPIVEGWQERVFYALDEIVLRDAGPKQVAREFVRRHGPSLLAEQRKNPNLRVVIYGDASGGNRSQTADTDTSVQSAWEIIFVELDQAGIRYEPRIQSKNPTVGDRVNYVNTQFMDATDSVGFRIDESVCTEIVADLQLTKYREGTNEIDKDSDPERTHMSDALGYVLWFERIAVAVERGDREDAPRLREFFNR